MQKHAQTSRIHEENEKVFSRGLRINRSRTDENNKQQTVSLTNVNFEMKNPLKENCK